VPDNAPANTLSFDHVTRVNLQAGAALTLLLPQPDVKNGNRTLFVKRETSTGTVKIRCVGCTLNGRASQSLPALPGLYGVFFDSANYFSTRPLAADWDGT
jgi:hypothetical protein